MSVTVYKARYDGDAVVVDWLICESIGQLSEAIKDGWLSSELDARAALLGIIGRRAQTGTGTGTGDRRGRRAEAQDRREEEVTRPARRSCSRFSPAIPPVQHAAEA